MPQPVRVAITAPLASNPATVEALDSEEPCGEGHCVCRCDDREHPCGCDCPHPDDCACGYCGAA